MKRTVGLYTLGCKVAQYETCAISESFAERGYTVVDFSDVADVYVINTCTVTAESDAKSRKMIRRAKKQNPSAAVIVCGCYSQRSPEEVFALREADAVVGTYGKMQIPDIAEKILSGGGRVYSVSDINVAPFEKMSIKSFDRCRAYLKIEDGCESKCSYCAIPSARGRVRSKPPSEVIDEVRALGAVSAEVVLTGIETGSYGQDLGMKCGLAELLLKIDDECPGVKIRLGSLAPELVGERFAEKIRGIKCLVPHFHISMQSGSDAILRRMKRRYTRDGALENIKRLRDIFPSATFTTDLMVGFPGENDEDFDKTLSLVDEAGFLSAHVFAYSRRKDTEAAGYPDQIDESVKRARSAALIAHAREVGEKTARGFLNIESSAVIESKSRGAWVGHTDNFIEFKLTGEHPALTAGTRLTVVPTKIENGVVYAEICK